MSKSSNALWVRIARLMVLAGVTMVVMIVLGLANACVYQTEPPADRVGTPAVANPAPDPDAGTTVPSLGASATPTVTAVVETAPGFLLDSPAGSVQEGLPAEQLASAEELWGNWLPYVTKMIEQKFVSGVVGKENPTGLQVNVVVDGDNVVMYTKLVDPNSQYDGAVVIPAETEITEKGLFLPEMPSDWSVADLTLLLLPEKGGSIYWDTGKNTFIRFDSKGDRMRYWNEAEKKWFGVGLIDESRMVWTSDESIEAKPLWEIATIEITRGICEREYNPLCGFTENHDETHWGDPDYQRTSGFGRLAESLKYGLSIMDGKVRPCVFFDEDGNVVKTVDPRTMNDPESSERPEIVAFDSSKPMRFVFVDQWAQDTPSLPYSSDGFASGWGVMDGRLVIVQAFSPIGDSIWASGHIPRTLYQAMTDRYVPAYAVDSDPVYGAMYYLYRDFSREAAENGTIYQQTPLLPIGK